METQEVEKKVVEKVVETMVHDNDHKEFSNILKVKADDKDIEPEERKRKVKNLAGAIAHGLRQFGVVYVRCFSPATDTLIEDISKGDCDVRDALRRFVGDGHIKKISNACQNIVEKIKVGYKDARILKGHRGTAKKRLKGLIDESNKYSRGYRLLNFMFDDKKRIVTFEVKRKDTKILRKTVRALERYKQKLEAKQSEIL